MSKPHGENDRPEKRETQASPRPLGVGNQSLGKLPEPGDFVCVDYWDHVEFRNCDPLTISPERRRRYGRLAYESHGNPQYIIVVSDEKGEPPSLKAGDPKAAGLVILRDDVLELRRIG